MNKSLEPRLKFEERNLGKGMESLKGTLKDQNQKLRDVEHEN